MRHHRTVHRPRGTFTTLEEGPRFKIKRIVVKPGASLSLQFHHHRSEHWVVLSGTAKVAVDDNEVLLRPDESTYIRAGNNAHGCKVGGTDLEVVTIALTTEHSYNDEETLRAAHPSILIHTFDELLPALKDCRWVA